VVVVVVVVVDLNGDGDGDDHWEDIAVAQLGATPGELARAVVPWPQV
jgi:hypothetical protein